MYKYNWVSTYTKIRLPLLFIEINILDSFDLKGGENGLKSSTSFEAPYGFYFAKTHKNIVASKEVLQEVVDLLKMYKSFIITMKIRPEPYHKGSILWLEQKQVKIFVRFVLIDVITKQMLYAYGIFDIRNTRFHLGYETV